MALTAAMGSGIAGLRAFMDALNVVGNNVANVNTYGYKAGRVTFSESIYSTQSAGSASTETTGGTNPNQIGYGSSVGTIDLDMSTQALESTGMATDVAIQGDGFFLLGNKNGVDVPAGLNSLMFSRVGNFKIDDDGYLTDGAGNIVYGFVPTTGKEDPDGNGVDDNNAAGTTMGGISTQLVPIRLPLAALEGNQWGAKEGAAVYPGVQGGKNQEITADANVSDKCIKYENLQIDSSGKVTCTNSMTDDIVTIGYIALGTVTNPAGLTHTDGPYYQATDSAGDIAIGTPKSSVTGTMNNGAAGAPSLLASSGTGVKSGFLEQSGTDLAQEFANMIIYQRGYQANTRIVTVTDTMLEELINMKR